jgi:hypothetical protein
MHTNSHSMAFHENLWSGVVKTAKYFVAITLIPSFFVYLDMYHCLVIVWEEPHRIRS